MTPQDVAVAASLAQQAHNAGVELIHVSASPGCVYVGASGDLAALADRLGFTGREVRHTDAYVHDEWSGTYMGRAATVATVTKRT